MDLLEEEREIELDGPVRGRERERDSVRWTC